jgi:hypothetical protein
MKKFTTVLLLLIAIASLFVFSSIVAFASSAPPAKQTKTEIVTAEGTIQNAGITTYQYGRYILVDKSGHTLYALRSSTLDLDQYVGKDVTITGTLVPGYPLDGGPPYLDAQSVS